MFRSAYWTVGIAIILVTSMAAPVTAIGVADQPTPTPETSQLETGTAEISDTLQNASNETTVVVRLREINQAELHAETNATATLQSQAERTQQPLLRFVNSTAGVTVEKQFWITNAVVLTVDTSRIDLDRIATVEGVERLHEDFEMQVNRTQQPQPAGAAATRSPNLTANNHATYGLEQINAPEVWDQFGTKGEGATVAVIDSGVDVANHPELAPIEGGWTDLVNYRQEPYDNEGHGTHVTGTVVGHEATSGYNEGTAYGVAPNADLLHAKVLNEEGTALWSDSIEAVEWAVNHESDVDVISISLGSEGYSTSWIDPIENARAAGVVMTISIGNDGNATSGSPGNVYSSIAVGASTDRQTIADFSSGEVITTNEAWGISAPATWPEEYTVPDVAAPGARVLSSINNGGYDQYSGTSMAAPHVAGAVALIQSATETEHTPTEIESALRRTAWKPADRDVDADTRYGSGIINVQAAIEQLANPTYEVEGLDAPDTVRQNESYTVNATVTNRGVAVPDNVTYTLENANGEATTTTSERVSLASNESTGVNLTIPANQTASLQGEYTHVVTTATSSITQPIEITEPPEPAATRQIDRPTVEPNGTVQVTVSMTVPDDSSDLRITENISTGSAVQDVAVVDRGNATVATVTDANDQVFASYGGTNTATVTYEITAGNASTVGDQITLNGTAVDTDNEIQLTTTGDTTVEVNTDPVLTYAGEDGIVDAGGLGEAAADFRAGSIGAGTLGDVAAAYRSGEPVE